MSENLQSDKSNIVIGNNNEIKIEDPVTRLLLYEREAYFLNKEIDLKDKEIEARDRDIELFKKMIEKMEVLEAESQKSRQMIIDLYERKINDLKRTIEILQGNKLS